LTKQKIEDWLISHQGYLKKSPIEAAKAIWKNSPKHFLPKGQKELQKDLALIGQVQSDLRKAKSIETERFDDGLLDIYQKIIDEKNRPKKILLYDIETSFNITWSWQIGRKISLSDDNIIEERKIITICYKWLNDPKTYSLVWKNGCDKELLKKFAKIAESADMVLGHNSDNFDCKHIRTRCLYHNVPFPVKLNQIDTLKMARAGYKFNSNKLNFIGKFLGVGEKVDTGGIQLWKDVILHKDKKALDKMVNYCIGDILLLEKVYNKLKEFSPEKRFKFTI